LDDAAFRPRGVAHAAPARLRAAARGGHPRADRGRARGGRGGAGRGAAARGQAACPRLAAFCGADNKEYPGTTVIDFLTGFTVWLGQLLLAWLIPLCFVALVLLSYKMLRAMPRTKPLRLEPSRGLQVRWEDVAGADEAREELQEI